MTRRDHEPTTGRQPKEPTWLTERCPSWCAREHGQLDHPEDRYHQSEASLVSGIVALRQSIPFTASLEALDLITWIGRYVGDAIDCLVIEPTERREPRLVVTVETAQMLVRRVTEQLARHQQA